MSEQSEPAYIDAEYADAEAFSEIRRVLTAHSVGEVFTLDRSCVGRISAPFQFMIPALLQRKYAEWDESLDDFRLAAVWLEERLTVSLLGLAQLITSQEYVHACIWLTARDDMRGFMRMRCGLGIPGNGRLSMESLRWNAPNIPETLCKLGKGPEPRIWVYSAGHEYDATGFYFDRRRKTR